MERSARLIGTGLSFIALVGCQGTTKGASGATVDRDATVAVPADGGIGDEDPDDAGDGAADAQPPGDNHVAPGEIIDTVVAEEDSSRYQIADIVPLGDREFAVGYLDSTRRLKYAHWDDNGRQGSPSFAGADDGRWVRADTSGPIERPDSGCLPVGVARINTMAFERGTDIRTVHLDVHTTCAGRVTFVSHQVAEGARPSSATTGSIQAGTARTLVVYGRQDLLAGRFLFHSAAPETAAVLGDEFPIAHFTLGGVFSTDVIYNQHSHRFIVGYIQRGGFGCSVWNVALADDTGPPAVLSGPTQFGTCDGDKGGHHTSVAYDPGGDGSYAWWRQDMNLVKSVVIHDQFGQPTSIAGLRTANTAAFGNIWTVPVAATADPLVPYLAMFGVPDVHLFYLGAGWQWTDWLPTFGPAFQIALRALPTGVVGLVRAPEVGDLAGRATLRIVRAPLPSPLN